MTLLNKIQILTAHLNDPRSFLHGADDVMKSAVELSLGSNLRVTGDFRLRSAFSELFGKIANDSDWLPPADLNSQVMFPGPVGQNTGAAFAKEAFASISAASEADVFALLRLKGTLLGCGLEGYESVSLFQFTKSVLAFDFALRNGDADRPFLMVGADLSGVQSFLYDIVSKKAAKNLKGRSFYLQMLLINIETLVLEACKAPSFCTVYNSGGGFYILLPNNIANRETLSKVREQVVQAIFEEHGTTLYASLAWLVLDQNKIQDTSYAWRELSKNLGLQKRQRYTQSFDVLFNELFEPFDFGSSDVDAITGSVLPAGAPRIKLKNDRDDNEQYISVQTAKLIELGRTIRTNKDWYIIKDGKLSESSYGIKALGVLNVFGSKAPTGSVIRHLNINEIKGASEPFWYGGDDYPHDAEGYPMPFDEFVEGKDYKRLGVLRMDVDNLGQVFIRGLEDSKRRFCRYAEISAQLDRFFTSHINAIRKRLDENRLFILYSGGDDLFIVGEWTEVYKMAAEIRKDFGKYTTQHPKMSLSGGIAVVTDRFPIMKAAALAGHSEELAKSHIAPDNRSKNALAIDHEVFGWDEFEDIDAWRKRWQQRISNKEVSQALIYRLYRYRAMKNRINDPVAKKRIDGIRWQWQATYSFARHLSQKKLTPDFASELNTLVVSGANNYRALDRCCIGARLAELETRVIKGNN